MHGVWIGIPTTTLNPSRRLDHLPGEKTGNLLAKARAGAESLLKEIQSLDQP